MRRHEPQVAGVFPSLSSDVVGGIETSGRLARDALVESFDRAISLELPIMNRKGAGSPMLKALAAVRAASIPRPQDLLLVWHVALLALLPLLRSRGGRTVVFLHGVEAWNPLRKLPERQLGKVDLFLSNSDYTWERFLGLHSSLEVKSHVTVPLGFGEPVISIPEPSPTPVAVMMGRLNKGEDYKGHRQVIAAWPKVQERLPRARLVIVGDGDLRPDLEALTRNLNVGRDVEFAGRVDELQKARLLSDSRCLVLPSKGEGFGIVYVEAMRLGRPCLVSTEDAGREVVHPPEAGLAVHPDDPDALTDALVDLLADGPRWTKWSRAAQARHANLYTGRAFKSRLVDTLKVGTG